MAKPKMTKWFNARTQPPVREGWYEFEFHERLGSRGEIRRHYWTGREWFNGAYSDERWRGLAEPPKDARGEG